MYLFVYQSIQDRLFQTNNKYLTFTLWLLWWSLSLDSRCTRLYYLHYQHAYSIYLTSYESSCAVNTTTNAYLLQSNVDSSWKTCARENTVRVFFLRFDCIEPFMPGEPPSDGRSGLSSSASSSMQSWPSSSDSLEVFR